MNIIDMILGGLLPLLVAIICNIALGLYYKIGVEQFKFSSKKLISGILKAAIVGGSFCAMAYCFGATGLGGELVQPQDIISAATILYMAKSIDNLMAIFGVKLSKKTT